MTVNRCPPGYPESEEKAICNERQDFRSEYTASLHRWPVTDTATNIRLVGLLSASSQSKAGVAGSPPIPNSQAFVMLCYDEMGLHTHKTRLTLLCC